MCWPPCAIIESATACDLLPRLATSILDSMKRRAVIQFISAALCTCLAAQVMAQGNELYRYRNDQDVVVVDDSVPPEYVARGYEVLNERGVGKHHTMPGFARVETVAGPHREFRRFGAVVAIRRVRSVQ